MKTRWFFTLLMIAALLLSVFPVGETSASNTTESNVWTSIGPWDGCINILVIDPATPTTLYAGTFDGFGGGGVFKSTNGGENWSAVNTDLTNLPYVTTLAIDPVTPTTLYVGAMNGGVYKSTNGGGNWIEINTGLTIGEVSILAIDPATPTTLYVGTNGSGSGGGGVFKSTNSGGNWSAVNTGLTDTDVWTLAIDPKTPTTLYAGTYGGGVFISTAPLTLTVSTAGTGSGTVSLSPNQANYPIGTVVTLTAVPDAASVFAGWSGAVVTMTNPVTVTMDANKVVTATFTIETVTYTAPISASQWYTFGTGCGGVSFTNTGGIDAITLTASYGYPDSSGGGLPRRYDIAQHGDGTYSAQVQLCYNDADLVAAGIPPESEGDLHAYQYSAGSWVGYSTVDTINNTVMAGPITMVDGVWGLGIPSDQPTAVTMQGLSASAHGDSTGLVFFAALCALLGLGLGAVQFARRVKAKPKGLGGPWIAA